MEEEPTCKTEIEGATEYLKVKTLTVGFYNDENAPEMIHHPPKFTKKC